MPVSNSNTHTDGGHIDCDSSNLVSHYQDLCSFRSKMSYRKISRYSRWALYKNAACTLGTWSAMWIFINFTIRLIHCGRVTHIYVSNLGHIFRRQAIAWTNDAVNQNLRCKLYQSFFQRKYARKCHPKWRPLCSGLNEDWVSARSSRLPNDLLS